LLASGNKALRGKPGDAADASRRWLLSGQLPLDVGFSLIVRRQPVTLCVVRFAVFSLVTPAMRPAAAVPATVR
jgi:hypothetical protein